ncbi:MAG: CinA family nicotinamide mononucleotide deamidase-related protein [Duncaniella sp.]|nr:CinA family nicotinamide mononucleotide deamidase-related protein [Duncaniella sp.]
MNISVIVIGDEILLGQVIDTNTSAIAKSVGKYGWRVNDVQVVADDAEAILRAIDRGFRNSDVIISTGGLGPTKDDITKLTLCRKFGGTLVEDKSVLKNIENLVSRRKMKLNDLTRAQAMVPTSCSVIQNTVGTAPVMWFETPEAKVLVAMPGVPFETLTALPEVVNLLREKFPSPDHYAHATLMVGDFTESALAEHLADWEEKLPPHLHLAYLPQPRLIRLRIDGTHTDRQFIESEVERAKNELVSLIGSAVLATQDLTPAEILLEECRKTSMTLATAESCTGGNIAHTLTLIPGASDIVAGGIVSYSNDVKMRLLKVRASDLETHGAVSIPVVEQMAKGALQATGATLSMATSGIAGPGGGTPEKPVGMVCIAAALCQEGNVKVVSETDYFTGTRKRVIDSATTRALLLALRLLRKS